MTIVHLLVYGLYLYLLTGLGFACWFVFRGVHKVDPGMKEGNWKLRLMLLPGSMALWPVMLRKLLKG